MRRLLVDIGNTRVKWAVLQDGRQGRQQAARHDGDGADVFRRMLARRRVYDVSAVCVAGEAVERAFVDAVLAAGLPSPFLVRSARSAAGVHNGYREPWRLGADRWAAAVGAWHLAGRRKTVLVASIGTASTIDLVTADGRHRGGLIAPGPELMVESLLRNTAGIARRAGGRGGRTDRAAFARDTRSAIERGALQATAGLVERAVEAARESAGRRPQLYLTGGAAADVAAELGAAPAPTLVPDLVLRGVALLSPPLR